ncbi:hypothetical protein LOAG_15108 [Loa loa]|uniref:BESS domain-containing protein n=1 Tax=Loa loa TaxID=7209 RepID=A0A1I7W0S3_LOALO|nr:hypothetical protein LOAG_15108 [Loa loa]EFO13421.2 hypothetical protein LOAG_15108 [Loa loa]
MNHGELRSKRHQISTKSSSESSDSKDYEVDEESDDELAAPASDKTSESASSEDDHDDSEDEIPAVIFNHPLVNDLLDRFMRAQLQTDTNVNNINHGKNAGKKFEFLINQLIKI